MPDPRPTSPLVRFSIAVIFGWALAIACFVWMLIQADPWNVLANTRVLDLFVSLGIIQYSDQQLGIIEGLPELELWVRSQDPVEVWLLLAGLALYLAYWLVEARRFRASLELVGATVPRRKADRAFLFGAGYGRFLPFRVRDAAIELALEPSPHDREPHAPVDPHHLRQGVAVFEHSVLLFQIGLFAIVGFIIQGFAATVNQALPGLIILGAAFLAVRKTGLMSPTWFKDFVHNSRHLLRSPRAWSHVASWAVLSMLLDDIAPYLFAQALTSTHVIMGIPFITIQGAVLSGYIATRLRITPKGIGQYELAFAMSLNFAGVGMPEAVTIALVDSAARHLIGIIISLAARRRIPHRLGAVLTRYFQSVPEAAVPSTPSSFIAVPFPRLPDLLSLSGRMIALLWILIGFFLLDRLAFLLMDLWVFEQQGLDVIFWTNFNMGLLLFAIGLTASLVPIWPVMKSRLDRRLRRTLIHGELMLSLFDALALSAAYFPFLLMDGVPFGQTDPVFGHDIGWYTYTLPAYEAMWLFAVRVGLSTLIAWSIVSWLDRDPSREPDSQGGNSLGRVTTFLGHLGTRGTRVTLLVVAAIFAVGALLWRYEVLFMDNTNSSIFGGPSYVDVEGLFSTVNSYWVLAAAILGFGIALFITLGRLHQRVTRSAEPTPAPLKRRLTWALIAPILLASAFPLLVRVRDTLFVTPNEPVIQLGWIKHHIDQTRFAYGFNEVETVSYRPKRPGDPLPTAEQLLSHVTVKNAPLWPGFVSYLEDVVDPQHAQRILQTQGDPIVYGPLLEVFRQQQQLRAYYDFMDIDIIRYPIDGEKTMLVSAVREVPLLEPKPWLAWWGQRFMLFTHGEGLITAKVHEKTADGLPVYTTGGMPATTEIPALKASQQRVYYGEGAGSIAYTNVANMEEFDSPTDEGRQTIWYPKDVDAGIYIDSFIKRLVFGYTSGQFFEVLMSDLITDETRAHYFRTPYERADRLFGHAVHYDNDAYAVIADDKITWLVNGITYTDHIPGSRTDQLGDKSDRRTHFQGPQRMVNYARDAIKVTVDAFTGETRFYKVKDEPLTDTLAQIYPGVIRPLAEMPASLRAQLQYPAQLFHFQFDDTFILYQMSDPMTFFNMEDMFDDADEVLGPILDEGHAIRFSIEPFQVLVPADGSPLPRAQEPIQFAMAMVFTPEGSWNIRSIPMVYQDGPDYGRIVNLQVPKGYFTFGPEQADTFIDQHPDIAMQLTWWTRRGLEVIRGHTTTLIAGDEVLFVEPLFLRSRQNPIPELKRVIVVFRGTPAIGDTLEEALRKAIADHAAQPEAPAQ